MTILIMLSCVCAIHLGLVDAIEERIGREIPVVGCPKCLTFWCVLTYGIASGDNVFQSIAVAFLLAYLSLWVKLLMGATDKIYMYLYGKIYPSSEDDEDSADHDGRTERPVSRLRQRTQDKKHKT